ncbi:hypothetical protein [Oharaeibacter diazotrophicus]|nr:hypothetical protein [Oharaeibacter diazotrophicus]
MRTLDAEIAPALYVLRLNQRFPCTMSRFKIAFAVLAATALSGCVTVEKTSFATRAGQQVVVRSGTEAVLSQVGSTQVIIAPASRAQELPRPAFVALIRNVGRAPVTFRYADISVTQADTGKPLKVLNVDELQAEARRQAIALAIIGGVAGAAGGYYAGSVNVNGNNYNYSGYNSGVGAALASSNINAATTAGELNVAALENTMLMDNTILPGESYGGLFQFDPAKVAKLTDPKNYIVNFRVGRDLHQIRLTMKREKVQ